MPRQLSNWLTHYLQFTENSEPPKLYHLWSGITAISSCLQRKCYTNWGLRGNVYPNIYVCLVGPPGGRKGTAMKIAKKMIQKIDVQTGSDSLGSVQVLYKQLRDHEQMALAHDGTERPHKSLSIWSEEFQVFLSHKDDSLMRSLTDLFDCPDHWSYDTLKRGLEPIDNCWLTIIGAITPSLLQTKLSLDAVGGGLLSRIILVVGYGPEKRLAFQFLSPEEECLRQKLIEDLEQIKLLSGPFILKQDFLNIYGPWYEQYAENRDIDSEKFLGYNSRRALHLNKLCMIISAAESDEMEIRRRHFEIALAILEATEAEMPNAFYGIGQGAHAEIYAKLDAYFNQHQTVDYTDLIKKFQLDAMPTELDQLTSLMEKTGKIEIERSSTGKTRFHVLNQKQQSQRASTILNKTIYSQMKGNQ